MKRLITSLLVLAVLVGQAPAWALACGQRCMPHASLACLRVCAKSKDLLTQGGKLPSLGQACGQVETRFAQPSLAALRAPSLVLPNSSFAVPATLSVGIGATLAVLQRAHGPPALNALQAVLPVPVAQAPPTFI